MDPISKTELAKLLKISGKTIQRMVAAGVFTVVRRDGNIPYFYPVASQAAYTEFTEQDRKQRQLQYASDELLRSKLERTRSHNRRLQQKVMRLQSECVAFDDLSKEWDDECERIRGLVRAWIQPATTRDAYRSNPPFSADTAAARFGSAGGIDHTSTLSGGARLPRSG